MTKNLYRQSFLLIPAFILLALSLVAWLTWKGEKQIRQKNGFSRSFVANKQITLVSAIRRAKEITYYAGSTTTHLFFQTSDVSKLIAYDTTLSKCDTIHTNVPKDSRITSAFEYQIDSPSITLFAKNKPAVFTGDLNDGSLSMLRFPRNIYSRAVKISPSLYCFKAADTTKWSKNSIFLTGSPSSNKIFQYRNLMGNQRDGGIASDGFLHYDKSGLLVYVYFYSNKILCLDTNLNIINTLHTIDTFETSTIKTGSIDMGKIEFVTSTGPTRIINRDNCVYGGTLYVQSTLRADNEDLKSFNNHSVVDMYDLKKTSYRGSFSIPSYYGEQVDRLQVIGNKLLIMYPDYITVYCFN